MKDILETILIHKKLEVEQQKEAVTQDHLEKLLNSVSRSPISLRQNLQQSSSGIIAEFKRYSPSKGAINAEADPTIVIPAYEQNGAAALSILTDTKFFGGQLYDIQSARPLTHLPILRKDFIIDEYQLYQARIIGADAVLLIASILTKTQCRNLSQIAYNLGLEVLLEIHCEQELDYITDDIALIGINNRNLGTFNTDVKHSFDLSDKLPKNRTLVSESGISQPETISALKKVGFKGFLIGETFMKTISPGETLADFIRSIP